jgi:GTP-binding protein
MRVSATFSHGAAALSAAPAHTLPEIAFLGRSNVGKSSLLNMLCQDAALARVSKTPGRTQQLNFFVAQLVASAREQYEFMLVDVPGFGYAKLAGQKRVELDQLIREYLLERSQLSTIILLNDCRRDPGDEERAVQELSYEREIPLIVILTKCDKLKKRELSLRRKALAGQYHLEQNDLIVSDKDSSPLELLTRIRLLLGARKTAAKE